jgi:hypothetical protein
MAVNRYEARAQQQSLSVMCMTDKQRSTLAIGNMR